VELTGDLYIAFLRLLLAIVDEDDVRAHQIIQDADAEDLAHFCAHKLVDAMGEDPELPDIREEILRALREAGARNED
jgi:hypothetical protein